MLRRRKTKFGPLKCILCGHVDKIPNVPTEEACRLVVYLYERHVQECPATAEERAEFSERIRQAIENPTYGISHG